MGRTRRWLLGVLGLVAGPWAGTAAAQGFGVYEHGSCAMGVAGAVVAAPCADGSTIFFNPAGLVGQSRVVSAGATLIAPSGGFTNQFSGLRDELNDRVYPVPHAYFVTPVNDRLAAGIGLFVPYGLETDWPATAQGRFAGYTSKIQGFYLQPTAAYRVLPWLSVGAGIDLAYVRVELRQRLDLSEQGVPGAPGVTFGNLGVPTRTDFADIDLTGHGTNVGFNVGVLLEPAPWISFGVRYLSRQEIAIDGGTAEIVQVPTGLTLAPNNPAGLPGGTPVDAIVAGQFAPGGTLTNQGAATSLRFPEQLVLGTAVDLSERVRVMLDYQYTNWKVFEELPIAFEKIGDVALREDFEATSDLRIGGEYMLSDATRIRLGFLTHNAAAPPQTVTPNLPEGPRSEVTLGFGTRLFGSLHVDVAYQYIDQADRRGRSGTGSTPPTAGDNDGLYTFDAHLFGASFRYAF